MGMPSLMPPHRIIILVFVTLVVSPSLGAVTDDKCKCLMCVCDVDPHPLPPALPSHRPPPLEPEPTPEYYYPPPSEPEPTPEYYPPPSEPEPTPVYYYPPPAGYYYSPPAYYPGGQTYGQPAQMYPWDRSYNPSSAHRPQCHAAPSLILACSVMAGVLALII